VKYFLFLFAFAKCAPAHPDFVSKHGVEFFLGGADWTKEAVDELEDGWLIDLEAASDGKFPNAREKMKGVQVFVQQEELDCPWTGGSGKCLGLQYGNQLQVVALNYCPATSAYVHEMLHWFEEVYYNINENEHSAPYWRTVHLRTCE